MEMLKTWSIRSSRSANSDETQEASSQAPREGSCHAPVKSYVHPQGAPQPHVRSRDCYAPVKGYAEALTQR